MDPEARLQSNIVAAIKREYPRAWIFHPVGNPYQESGVPDLLVCVDGRFVALELKDLKPGETEEHARERTSTTQRVQIRRIQRAGGVAGTVLSVAEALDLVKLAQRPTGERDDPAPLKLAGWADVEDLI